MEYRTNRKTGDRFSEIGLGTAYLFEAGMDAAIATAGVPSECSRVKG